MVFGSVNKFLVNRNTILNVVYIFKGHSNQYDLVRWYLSQSRNRLAQKLHFPTGTQSIGWAGSGGKEATRGEILAALHGREPLQVVPVMGLPECRSVERTSYSAGRFRPAYEAPRKGGEPSVRVDGLRHRSGRWDSRRDQRCVRPGQRNVPPASRLGGPASARNRPSLQTLLWRRTEQLELSLRVNSTINVFFPFRSLY